MSDAETSTPGTTPAPSAATTPADDAAAAATPARGRSHVAVAVFGCVLLSSGAVMGLLLYEQHRLEPAATAGLALTFGRITLVALAAAFAIHRLLGRSAVASNTALAAAFAVQGWLHYQQQQQPAVAQASFEVVREPLNESARLRQVARERSGAAPPPAADATAPVAPAGPEARLAEAEVAAIIASMLDEVGAVALRCAEAQQAFLRAGGPDCSNARSWDEIRARLRLLEGLAEAESAFRTVLEEGPARLEERLTVAGAGEIQRAEVLAAWTEGRKLPRLLAVREASAGALEAAKAVLDHLRASAGHWTWHENGPRFDDEADAARYAQLMTRLRDAQQRVSDAESALLGR